jgi:predicted O-methyltransferase YrrM
MDDRFLFIRGDSGKREDMERLSVARTHYDVIIEDASHASYHQQMALLTLWDKLTPGGLFIIEDTNWQPPVFEESMPAVPKTTDFLRSLFEQGTYMENDLLSQSFSEHLRDTTQCASFFPTFEEGGRTRVKIIVLLKTK